jgi:hypothetical protein
MARDDRQGLRFFTSGLSGQTLQMFNSIGTAGCHIRPVRYPSEAIRFWRRDKCFPHIFAVIGWSDGDRGADFA